MRDIDTIIVHCSATPPSMDIGVHEIRLWHVSEPRCWSDIGYHFVIKRDGTLEPGRPVEREGAHARGHNSTSIGICLVGGVKESGDSESNFTFSQYCTLDALIDELKVKYEITDVIGHNEISSKDCPCFNVQEFLL